MSHAGRGETGILGRPTLVDLLWGGSQSPGDAGDRARLAARRFWQGELPLLSPGKINPDLAEFFCDSRRGSNPLRLAVVISDITEQKRAEEELADSEAKYRHLVETTDTGYLILDEEGRVADANLEYVRLTGHRSLREIMGRSVVEWTAPYDVERNIREVQKCFETGAVRQLEIDYIDRDGKVTPIEINASTIEAKQGRQIISLCRDITDRKQSEEILHREPGPSNICWNAAITSVN